jgi:hypothetical protein
MVGTDATYDSVAVIDLQGNDALSLFLDPLTWPTRPLYFFFVIIFLSLGIKMFCLCARPRPVSSHSSFIELVLARL